MPRGGRPPFPEKIWGRGGLPKKKSGGGGVKDALRIWGEGGQIQFELGGLS